MRATKTAHSTRPFSSAGPRRPKSSNAWGGVVVFLALWLASASGVEGQRVFIEEGAQGELQELRLNDGSTLIGRVVATGDPIDFELSSGATLKIDRSQIASIREFEGTVRGGEIWERDPSPNRLFFGPTGRTIGQGRGYIASVEAIFATVGLGLHDRVSVAAGTALVGGDATFVWAIPKIQIIDQPTAALSIGALAATLDSWGFGILWSALTLGPVDRALHLGMGYGYWDDELADTPMFMAGAEARLSGRVKLITENYLFPGNGGILSLGPRFIGETLSADLGVGMWFNGGEAFKFPLVNFVYNW